MFGSYSLDIFAFLSLPCYKLYVVCRMVLMLHRAEN